MNFSEALELLKQGKKIRRPSCKEGWYLQIHPAKFLDKFGQILMDIYASDSSDNEFKYSYKLCSLDILADDWEVVDE